VVLADAVGGAGDADDLIGEIICDCCRWALGAIFRSIIGRRAAADIMMSSQNETMSLSTSQDEAEKFRNHPSQHREANGCAADQISSDLARLKPSSTAITWGRQNWPLLPRTD
jgi:hypothetical protein